MDETYGTYVEAEGFVMHDDDDDDADHDTDHGGRGNL